MTGRNVSGIREFGGSRVAATRSRSVLSEMEIHPYHLGRVIGTEMCHRAARNNKSISTSDTLSLVISGGQSHRGSNKFEQVRRKSHTLRRLYRFPAFTLTAFFQFKAVGIDETPMLHSGVDEGSQNVRKRQVCCFDRVARAR